MWPPLWKSVPDVLPANLTAIDRLCRLDISQRIGDGLQCQINRCQDFGRTPSIIDQLPRCGRNAQESGVRENCRRPKAKLIVQLATQGDHQVRLAHRRSTDRPNDRGVIGWHQSTAFLGVQIQRTGRIQEAYQGGICPHGPPATDNQRATGGANGRNAPSPALSHSR